MRASLLAGPEHAVIADLIGLLKGPRAEPKPSTNPAPATAAER